MDAAAYWRSAPPTPPPSSPRRDLIPSLTHRVAALFRAGSGKLMLNNAAVADDGSQRTGSRLPSYRSAAADGDCGGGGEENPSRIVDRYLRRRGVFELLDPDLVVEGMVCNKTDEGVVIQIEQVFKIEVRHSASKAHTVRPKYRESTMSDLKDLDIQGFCPLSEISDTGSTVPSHAALDHFSLGSNVKALVISVDIHTEAIYFSLNNDRLEPHQEHHVLGLIRSSAMSSPSPSLSSVPASPMHHWRSSSWFSHPSKIPFLHPASSSASSPSSSPSQTKGMTFCQRLRDHPLFRNPEGQNIIAKAFSINDRGTLFHHEKCDPADMYLSLRQVQNHDWAFKSVSRGAELAKSGQLEEAIRCYNEAIDVDAQCTDAFVARGAAYVRLEEFDQAVKDLEHALTLDSGHENAVKYLKVALARGKGMTATAPSTFKNHKGSTGASLANPQ